MLFDAYPYATVAGGGPAAALLQILPRVRTATLQPLIVLVMPPSLARLRSSRGATT